MVRSYWIGQRLLSWIFQVMKYRNSGSGSNWKAAWVLKKISILPFILVYIQLRQRRRFLFVLVNCNRVKQLTAQILQISSQAGKKKHWIQDEYCKVQIGIKFWNGTHTSLIGICCFNCSPRSWLLILSMLLAFWIVVLKLDAPQVHLEGLLNRVSRPTHSVSDPGVLGRTWSHLHNFQEALTESSF